MEEQLVSIARNQLGPASARAASEPEPQASFACSLEAEVDPLDAAFSALYPVALRDSGVAGEFMNYFMTLLLRRSEFRSSSGKERGVEPEDLLQSVVADLFPRLHEIEFRSRGEFLNLLLMRLRWKRSSRRPREDVHFRESLLASALPEHVPGVDEGPSTPLSSLVREEEEELVVLALQELSRDDQMLIRASLENVSREQMARDADCSPPTLRKRLERARRNLRAEVRKLASQRDDRRAR